MKHRFVLRCWSVSVLLAEVSTLSAGGGLQRGDLVIARNRNSVIQRFDGTTGAFIADFVPDVGGLFVGLDADLGPDGNIYVASSGSGRITRHNGITGEFLNVVVPYGAGGLNVPIDLTVGPTGDIYAYASITPSGAQLLRFDSAGNPLASAILAPENVTHGIAIAPSGDLVVGTYTNSTTYRIRRFDSTTLADLGDFVSSGGGLPGIPSDFVFRPDGYLYVAHLGPQRGVSRFDAATGAFVDIFVSPAPGPSNTTLAFDGNGDLYIATFLENAVHKYSGINGSPLGVFIPAGTGGIVDLWRALFLDDDSLLVLRGTNGAIRFDGVTGSPLGTFIADGFEGNLVGPRDCALSTDGGSLFVWDSGGPLRRFDRWTGDFVENLIASPLFDVTSFTMGPGNDFYGAERAFGSNRILHFDGETGAVGTFVPSGSGSLNFPGDLTFGPDGHLYVISTGNDKVLKYDGLSGSFLGEFVASGSGGLNSPVSLGFGPDGHLYISDFQSDSVLRYDGQSGQFIGAFVASGAGGLDGPSVISFGPNHNLYVVSRNNAVLEYAGQTGSFIGEFVPPEGAPGDTRGMFFVSEATVPAVSTWGMAILALLLSTFATLLLRNRASIERCLALKNATNRGLIAGILFFPVAAWGQLNVGSDGSDGAFTPACDITVDLSLAATASWDAP